LAAALGALGLLAAISGCSSSPSTRSVTLEQIEELRSIEVLLPVSADSVVARYRRYEPQVFYASYSSSIQEVTRMMESLNRPLPPAEWIDTLAIDHTFENIGEAARQGKTLYLSASYFYLYESLPVLRSVVTHEFGHIYLNRLSPGRRTELDSIWGSLRNAALFFVFHEGEYSENARFGGHPEDSPEELFASAFNLFRNRPDEVTARAQFVTAEHRQLVSKLGAIVEESYRAPR
jgi:hypothetical protein